jgi:hypothetical protein
MLKFNILVLPAAGLKLPASLAMIALHQPKKRACYKGHSLLCRLQAKSSISMDIALR